MNHVAFTKESAQYARECLDGMIGAMRPELRAGTSTAAHVIRRFIAAAKAAAPRETHS